MEFCKNLQKKSCRFNCFSGLKAISSANKGKIKFKDTRKILASIDIDTELEKSYPQASRWDYLVVYDNKLCFIEIHPVSNKRGLNEVVKKKAFIKKWLKGSDNCAKAINSFTGQKRFFVIPTGTVSKNPKAKNYLSPYGISIVDRQINC